MLKCFLVIKLYYYANLKANDSYRLCNNMLRLRLPRYVYKGLVCSHLNSNDNFECMFKTWELIEHQSWSPGHNLSGFLPIFVDQFSSYLAQTFLSVIVLISSWAKRIHQYLPPFWRGLLKVFIENMVLFFLHCGRNVLEIFFLHCKLLQKCLSNL